MEGGEMIGTQRAVVDRITGIAQTHAFFAASLLVGAAFLVRWLLDPWLGESHAFAAFYPAIFGGAYLLGRTPAYFASLLAGVGGQWAFLHPRFGWKVDAQNLAPLLFFVVTVGAGVWLITSLSSAQRRSEAVRHHPDEVSVASQPQAEIGTLREVSCAQFSRFMQGAIAEVDADLRSAPAAETSRASPLTLLDWWEHLSVVVMPELLLRGSQRRSWGFH
jgi:hypothetical protein